MPCVNGISRIKQCQCSLYLASSSDANLFHMNVVCRCVYNAVLLLDYTFIPEADDGDDRHAALVKEEL